MTKRSKKDQPELSAVKKLKNETKGSGAPEKNDWKDAICPVCVECPHEAVLLLYASHKNGCRPYFCDTSYEFSNCLDRYKEACPKTAELSCPLCQGKVTGWTVVNTAREFLNANKRTCLRDNCLFLGKYEELKNHMKLIHPLAKPEEVDPELEQEWKRMEEERERNDLMSTISATTPAAMVVGDFVFENPTSAFPDQTFKPERISREHDEFHPDGPKSP